MLCRSYVKLNQHTFPITLLNGFEKTSLPFNYSIQIKLPLNIDTEKLHYQKAEILLFQQNQLKRKIIGIIAAIETRIQQQDKNILLKINPRIHLLKKTHGPRIFLNKTAPESITELLINHASYQQHQIQWELIKDYAYYPFTLQAPNESDFDFIQRLLAQEKIFYWFDQKDNAEVICFSDHLNNPHERHAKRQLQLQNLTMGKNNQLIAKSTDQPISPGELLSINNNDWLVTAIKHHATDSLYSNRLYLSSLQSIDQLTFAKQPHIPLTLPAKVESNSQYAYLDNLGRYRVRFNFDKTNRPITEASTPLNRLMPYGGKTSQYDNDDNFVGLHFPLIHNTPVFISFINGDSHWPFILAAVNSKQHPGPVNISNAKQNIIKTPQKQQITIDDNKNSSKFLLSTYQQHNYLLMNASPNDQTIQLQSKKGDINLFSKENLTISANNNINETTQLNKLQFIHENYMVQASNIHMKSKEDFTAHSKKTIHLTSKKNININANHHLLLNSDQPIKLQTKTLKIKTQKGKLKIQCKKINIKADKIHISQKGCAGVLLNSSGNIIVYGKSVGGGIGYSTIVNQSNVPAPFPEN